MTTFEEFRQHYDLEADNPDSREQYRQYREAGDLMRRIVGGVNETPVGAVGRSGT